MIHLRAAARTVLLITFSLAVPARAANSESSPGQDQAARAIPGKHFYLGVGAQGLISRSPGLAFNGLVAFEANWFILTAEVGLGEDTTRRWDHLTLGGQLGAVLPDARDAPYILAGIEQSTILDFLNERRGRSDLLFTGEVGYVRRGSNGGSQLWLGLRGLLPLTSALYIQPPPDLPFAMLVLRFLV